MFQVSGNKDAWPMNHGNTEVHCTVKSDRTVRKITSCWLLLSVAEVHLSRIAYYRQVT